MREIHMYYIIVNPASRSGRGLKIYRQAEQLLKEKNIEFKALFSQKAGDVCTLVRDLCLTLLPETSGDMLKLIIVGGDGTFNEALQGVTDFDRVQLGYIPTGSSNDLARDLQFPKKLPELLDQILSCTEPFRMDLGCVTYHSVPAPLEPLYEGHDALTRRFAVSCGIGYDAAICEEALSSGLKKVLNRIGLGKLIYVAIALKQLIMTKRGNCTITLDEQEPFELKDFLFIASMIHRYEGGGFMFCPKADHTDGSLDICAVGPIAKPVILMALPSALKGQHYKFPHIYPYRTSRIRIDADRDFWVQTDGEVATKSKSVTIRCLQNRIQLLK